MTENPIKPEQLARELGKVVAPDRVHIDELTLTVYARCADFYEYRPLAVVKARSEAEVIGVLKVANQYMVPVTFRAAGTSLSGQTVGEGIICDISTGFQGIEARNNGEQIWFQPGPTLDMLDKVLEPLQRRVGPDPASSSAARMGGVIANNASGMTAGAKLNSYHTLHSLRVVLVDGLVYDSGVVADYQRFETEQERIAQGLLELRREILGNDELVAKIRKKFSIKCVTGYGINAFLDYEHPLDIFVHLMVGSEGTLGFVSEGVLDTLPLNPARSSSMLLFDNIRNCAAAVPVIEAMGAQALEVMNHACLMAYHNTPGMPEFVYSAPEGSCALLIDFWCETNDAVIQKVLEVEPEIRRQPGLLDMSPFTRRPEERYTLWDARAQLFGLLGEIRPPGTVLLTEDMAVPLPDLVAFVEGLEHLYEKHGYDQAVIGGHASAGNLHFMIIDDLRQEESMARFKAFMEDSVALVADELSGSLKAEHGTGRVVAPFVEREWGSDAYAVMKKLKALIDPDGLLNPDVLINDDPESYAANAKAMPDVWEGIDKCVECGFCEHVCPSRVPSLTPRQRIQASRKHMELLSAGDEEQAQALWKEYAFHGVDMCAADGMCVTQCPVKINTAEWTDKLRADSWGALFKGIATWASRRFGFVEGVLRISMTLGTLFNTGFHLVEWFTRFLHWLIPGAPVWSRSMGAAPRNVTNPIKDPDFVYYPACVSRIMGSSKVGKPSVTETVLTVAERAGLRLHVAENVAGTCCGQIWEHKGFEEGFALMANRIVERMWQWSEEGAVPVVCDVSTCTLTLNEDLLPVLSEDNRDRFQKLRILDINDWLHDDVLPRLEVTNRSGAVVLHPTCGCARSGSDTTMLEVAQACAESAKIPLNWNCCGTAGDRGFLHPELTDGAQLYEQEEVAREEFDGYYSVAKTCEINLSERSGKNYESIIYLVEEATRPST